MESGHQIRILTRESSKLDAIEGLDYERVTGDLFNVEWLAEQLQGIDWIFHVAAVSDYWRSNKKAIYRVNVDGTKNLLDAAQKAGVKRFIFTSTFQAVGFTPGGQSDENTAFNFSPRISPYGHSKVLAEAEAQKAVQAGLDVVTVNPAVVMGPGDLNEISGSLVTEVARGKLFVMPQAGGVNFIDVRDVAKGHLAAAEKGRTGERYILGSENMSHKDMMLLICEVIGKRPPKIPAPGFIIPPVALLVDALRAVKIPIPAEGNQLRLSRYEFYADTSKMRAELHIPEIDMRQSVEDTYRWYKENGYF
jgi:dihydroflavonol-4-reductase